MLAPLSTVQVNTFLLAVNHTVLLWAGGRAGSLCQAFFHRHRNGGNRRQFLSPRWSVYICQSLGHSGGKERCVAWYIFCILMLIFCALPLYYMAISEFSINMHNSGSWSCKITCWHRLEQQVCSSLSVKQFCSPHTPVCISPRLHKLTPGEAEL